MTIPGVDVSDYQGPVAWPTVASAGYQFMLAKGTEGTGFKASTFPRNWANAQAAGLARGAYHFARPDQNAPEAEADAFLARVGPLETGDVLALDLETGTGDLSAWALRWLKYVEGKVGFKPLLYTSPSFIAEHGLTVPALGEYGLWLASWESTPPAAPAPWAFWAIWQRGSGAVPGIVGDCDLNELNADSVDVFRAYGKPAVTPPAPVKPHLTDADRYQLVKYVTGGSGVADLTAWLAGFTD